MRKKEKSTRKLTGVIWAAVIALSFGCAPERDRPNFIIIMPDDVSYEAVHAYGVHDWVQSPNLDRLADEGIRFNNAFVTNSLCGPSRASVLSGLYSHSTGVCVNRVNENPEFETGVAMRKDIITFPEILQQNGYEIGFIGKTHTEPWLRDRGFDYYFGFKHQGQYRNPPIAEATSRTGPYEDKIHEGYLTDLLTDRAVKFLKKDRKQPFCLLLWHKDAHVPLDPHERYSDMYADQEIAPPDTWIYDRTGKPKTILDRKPVNDTPERRKSWSESKRKYYQLCYQMDQSVGEVLKTLDEQGLADNTVVLFTSDNGMNMGHLGLDDKRFMYESSIKVPFLVRYPKLVQAGKVNNENMVLNIDIAPTMLDLAGIPIPEKMHGRSFLPILKGDSAEWRKDWLYEYYEYPWYGNIPPFRGIRTDRYKYIFWYSRWPWERELYDLQNDPKELHNLAADTAYAGLIQELHQRMTALRQESNDPDIGKN